MTSPDPAPAGPGTTPAAGPGPAQAHRPDERKRGERPAAVEPVLAEQSPEDTDAAWGEYPERADDRLCRDRPPHWADY